MKRTLRGEIWRVDLGLAAKVRPALVLSDYPSDDELALLVIIPHTTALRHSRWELSISKPFLKPGAFHLQQVQPISLARLDVSVAGDDQGEKWYGQLSMEIGPGERTDCFCPLISRFSHTPPMACNCSLG